jgi:hypothetical protein
MRNRVIRRDPRIIPSGHLEYSQALFNRRLRISVKRTSERRIRKLRRAHQHKIAHHNQRLSLALDNIGCMARCVPMGRQRADTWRERDILVKALEFSRPDVWLKETPCELKPSFDFRIVVRFGEERCSLLRIEEDFHFAL